jgi:hypothetical protein
MTDIVKAIGENQTNSEKAYTKMIVKDLINTITLDEIKMVNEGKTTF